MNDPRAILCDCFDLLEEAPYCYTYTEKCELSGRLIDVLGQYRKPRKKKGQKEALQPQYAAFLNVNIALNLLGLAHFGYMMHNQAFSNASDHLSEALGFLTDHKKQ